MASRIEDYALIGDCQTAALVARDGSIDWLCLPRFDSGTCFAALLGTPEHGRWFLAPAGEVRQVSRRYREGTLILKTDYETDSGTVTLIDCMPLRDHEADIIRLVVGRRGQVAMHMQFIVRFDYGSVIPWVRRIEKGIQAIAGPDTVVLSTDVPLHGESFTTFANFTVSEGQSKSFVLAWRPSHKPAPPQVDPHECIRLTELWWWEWSDRCTYQGLWREAVVRSLITLKALTYAPTGGIAAAATTSLPEQLVGRRERGIAD